MKRSKTKLILLILCLLPVVVWVSSLIKCEILTHKYYDDFQYAYENNSMLAEPEYFKVLNCDNETARVYYVSQGKTSANVLTFQKSNGEWIETEWSTVWSTTGSASEVIYPYWWHFVYAGF